MHIKSPKAELVSGIKAAQRAVLSKSTEPILQCILIDAEGEKIAVIGNNLELGIQTEIYGGILEPGAVAVDAGLLANIVNKMPDDDIEIKSGADDRVVIQSGKTKFNIVGRSAENFTYPPKISAENSVRLSQLTFKEMVGRTLFCVGKYGMMNAEYFKVSSDKLTVVALDGYRIAIRKTELRQDCGEFEAIIPAKTLDSALKIISSSAEKEVDICFGERHVSFFTGETVITSRLIDGVYYNYGKMMKIDFSTRMTVNKTDFLSCLERVNLLVSENDKKPVILTVTPVEVTARIATGTGQMNEAIEIEQEGAELEIGFSAQHLSDAVKNADDEEVTVYMSGNKSPAVVKDDTGKYAYIVLPVHYVS